MPLIKIECLPEGEGKTWLSFGLLFIVVISDVYCKKRMRPCCRICRKEGPKMNRDLRRDCKCLNNRGFAHFSCTIKYAEHKSKEIRDVNDCQSFIEPWEICPLCRQEYRGKIALATKFVSFVANNYPLSQWRHVEALFLKLEALLRMARLHISDKAKDITNAVIEMIDQMKSDNVPLPGSISFLEADAQVYLGDFSSAQGSKDKVVKSYEKCRDMRQVVIQVRRGPGEVTGRE